MTKKGGVFGANSGAKTDSDQNSDAVDFQVNASDAFAFNRQRSYAYFVESIDAVSI